MSEEMKRQYEESKRMTSGTIFIKGNGILRMAVRDEVIGIGRNRVKETKEANRKEATKQRWCKVKKRYTLNQQDKNCTN